jgi:hypothetical protein
MTSTFVTGPASAEQMGQPHGWAGLLLITQPKAGQFMGGQVPVSGAAASGGGTQVGQPQSVVNT